MSRLEYASHLRLADYFRQQLRDHSAHHPDEETRWYLSDLLERFSDKDALFSRTARECSIRPLALLYDDAQQCIHERERCLLLRQLGDQALFLGALFPEHYARKGIQRDYFIGMGSAAYSYLAEHAQQLRSVFAQLAGGFSRLLDLVAEVCQRQRQYTAQEILSLYQRWQQTRQPRLARQLQAMGVQIELSDTHPRPH